MFQLLCLLFFIGILAIIFIDLIIYSIFLILSWCVETIYRFKRNNRRKIN